VPILLLGRKGSGKSSILAEFKIQARGKEGRVAVDQPPSRGEPFLISVDSWDHFHQLTRHVAKQARDTAPDFDAELVPTEYLSRLWKEAIWDDIILFFYNFCHHRESRAALTAVERYVLADVVVATGLALALHLRSPHAVQRTGAVIAAVTGLFVIWQVLDEIRMESLIDRDAEGLPEDLLPMERVAARLAQAADRLKASSIRQARLTMVVLIAAWLSIGEALHGFGDMIFMALGVRPVAAHHEKP